MEYELMISPINFDKFEEFKGKEIEKYFNWYMSQREKRIALLQKYVLSENVDINFDYSSESLVSLWAWYEKKIEIVAKLPEELESELILYPNWMHDYISKTKISLQTLKYGMDIAIYFAETVIHNSNGKVKWGYFTKPKMRMSVNEPTLLGFKNDMDLNPRLIVTNCTRQSSVEIKNTRLYDMYMTWIAYIE